MPHNQAIQALVLIVRPIEPAEHICDGGPAAGTDDRIRGAVR
jgi:hypothetical protein